MKFETILSDKLDWRNLLKHQIFKAPEVKFIEHCRVRQLVKGLFSCTVKVFKDPPYILFDALLDEDWTIVDMFENSNQALLSVRVASKFETAGFCPFRKVSELNRNSQIDGSETKGTIFKVKNILFMV